VVVDGARLGDTESSVNPEQELPPPKQSARSEREQTARSVAIGILALLVIVFAVLNSQTVKIKWIVTTTRMPLIVAIILIAAIGAAVGWLLGTRHAQKRAKA
jgi:uncharacterized integral membrane protein